MRNNCSQVVVENFFEPGILYLLMKSPSYGYEIQKALKDNCICEVNIGNLYRCLARMQKQGYVTKVSRESDVGPKRVSYTITKTGRVYLKSWIKALEEQNKIISLLIKNYKIYYEKSKSLFNPYMSLLPHGKGLFKKQTDIF